VETGNTSQLAELDNESLGDKSVMCGNVYVSNICILVSVFYIDKADTDVGILETGNTSQLAELDNESLGDKSVMCGNVYVSNICILVSVFYIDKADTDAGILIDFFYNNYGANQFSFNWNEVIIPMQDFKFNNMNATFCPLNTSLHCIWHIIISLQKNIVIRHEDFINRLRLAERGSSYKILEPDVQSDFNDILKIMLSFIETYEQPIATLDVGADLSCEVYTDQYDNKNLQYHWYDFWRKDCKVKMLTSNRIGFHYALMHFADHELTCILYFILAYLVLC
jgi:hypothetical protein